MQISRRISKGIQKALSEIGIKYQKDIHVEVPSDGVHGDYSTNIAMVVFSDKPLGKGVIAKIDNPRELAERIVDRLKSDKVLFNSIKRIEIAGSGFINFYLNNGYYLDVLSNFVDTKSNIFSVSKKPKKVIVEYSSPNIAKPFGIGHLRSTIIGDAIANLLEASGNTVYRDNHIGDWGTQFGKQIYAIKKWGSEKVIDKSENPAKELVSLYVKFHEEAKKDPTLDDEGRKWFKKLENKDKEARKLWQKCIVWSRKEFDDVYDKLNIKFTENDGNGYGESFFEDKTEKIINELNEKSLLTNSDGAQLIFFPQDKFPPLMIRKSDGTTLYSTRDLAADRFRLDHYGEDITIINEVGAEQALYFKQLFEAERMLGWIKEGQRIHVMHGLYRFPDRKMSTRRGDIIWLNDVLNEAYKRVTDISKSRISEQDVWKIAVGAIKWNDLKRRPWLDIIFDWDEILQVDGNSGPYIQYTYARCLSVLNKAKNFGKKSSFDTLNTDEKEILVLMDGFRDVVRISENTLSLHHLCNYLYTISRSYNIFYSKHSILDPKENRQKDFRLQLTFGVSRILKEGLKVLGINVVKRM